MATCVLAVNTQVSPEEVNGACARGCLEAACCVNTKAGVEHYLCLAQMRKRLGGEPEPGDKCGSCGIKFE
jgi:hypothetical protein